jgi:hypothetical protein
MVIGVVLAEKTIGSIRFAICSITEWEKALPFSFFFFPGIHEIVVKIKSSTEKRTARVAK